MWTSLIFVLRKSLCPSYFQSRSFATTRISSQAFVSTSYVANLVSYSIVFYLFSSSVNTFLKRLFSSSQVADSSSNALLTVLKFHSVLSENSKVDASSSFSLSSCSYEDFYSFFVSLSNFFTRSISFCISSKFLYVSCMSWILETESSSRCSLSPMLASLSDTYDLASCS